MLHTAVPYTKISYPNCFVNLYWFLYGYYSQHLVFGFVLMFDCVFIKVHHSVRMDIEDVWSQVCQHISEWSLRFIQIIWLCVCVCVCVRMCMHACSYAWIEEKSILQLYENAIMTPGELFNKSVFSFNNLQVFPILLLRCFLGTMYSCFRCYQSSQTYSCVLNWDLFLLLGSPGT